MKNSSHRPNPLLDPFVPAGAGWSLITAVSAGIFEALGQDPRLPAEVAHDLDLDVAGVERLMPVLVHLGYVESEGEEYRLSDVSRGCLTKESPHQLSNWVRFCRTQLVALSRLESALSTGQPIDLYHLMETREELRIHQLAMAETAMPVAQWVAANTPVPKGGEMMLDIGGSHGLYSAAICRQNPPLRAEVMELPAVIDVARSVAVELGTNDIVRHVEGDIRTADLTESYSVVFMGNLIHHFRAERLPGVLEKARGHLESGGTLAIWDLADERPESGLVSSLFSLFFYLTSTARCHPERQIKTMIEEAGFTRFRTIRPDEPSLHALYVARKPAGSAGCHR